MRFPDTKSHKYNAKLAFLGTVRSVLWNTQNLPIFVAEVILWNPHCKNSLMIILFRKHIYFSGNLDFLKAFFLAEGTVSAIKCFLLTQRSLFCKGKPVE